ncbi:type II toxin-antitoxin system RelE/ParE family toxin [Stutzerimonas balearica]
MVAGWVTWLGSPACWAHSRLRRRSESLLIPITKCDSSTMNRVFKTRHFSRWMRKTELTDEALCGAVREMAQGLIDADLGGGCDDDKDEG